MLSLHTTALGSDSRAEYESRQISLNMLLYEELIVQYLKKREKKTDGNIGGVNKFLSLNSFEKGGKNAH